MDSLCGESGSIVRVVGEHTGGEESDSEEVGEDGRFLLHIQGRTVLIAPANIESTHSVSGTHSTMDVGAVLEQALEQLRVRGQGGDEAAGAVAAAYNQLNAQSRSLRAQHARMRGDWDQLGLLLRQRGLAVAGTGATLALVPLEPQYPQRRGARRSRSLPQRRPARAPSQPGTGRLSSGRPSRGASSSRQNPQNSPRPASPAGVGRPASPLRYSDPNFQPFVPPGMSRRPSVGAIGSRAKVTRHAATFTGGRTANPVSGEKVPWECHACSSTNPWDFEFCRRCQGRAHSAAQENRLRILGQDKSWRRRHTKAPLPDVPTVAREETGDDGAPWQCLNCKTKNPWDVEACKRCQQPCPQWVQESRLRMLHQDASWRKKVTKEAVPQSPLSPRKQPPPQPQTVTESGSGQGTQQGNKPSYQRSAFPRDHPDHQRRGTDEQDTAPSARSTPDQVPLMVAGKLLMSAPGRPYNPQPQSPR